jgi:hypothetical protein
MLLTQMGPTGSLGIPTLHAIVIYTVQGSDVDQAFELELDLRNEPARSKNNFAPDNFVRSLSHATV